MQPVPVVRNSSLKRRSLERSESGRMRLTKVGVHAVYTCDEIIDKRWSLQLGMQMFPRGIAVGNVCVGSQVIAHHICHRMILQQLCIVLTE